MQFNINNLRVIPPESKQSLEYAVKMAGKSEEWNEENKKETKENSSNIFEKETEEVVKLNETIAELTKWLNEKEAEVDELINCYQLLNKDINNTLMN